MTTETDMKPDLRTMVRQARRLPPPEMAKAIRRAAGVSQEAIANEIGVSRQTIAFWESGARRPSTSHLSAYLRALNMLEEESGGRPAA